MCAKKFTYNPDYAVAPGETIREVMEYLGMTQREFAMRLDTTVQSINRIFKGDQGITAEMANKLERVTGTPSSFWNALEWQYRSQLVRMREAEEFQSQQDWLAKIPTKELESRGYIKRGLECPQKFEAVLKFFSVSSVQAWEHTWAKPAVAARRSLCFDSAPYLSATWIRMGEIEAQKIICGPTDIKKFKSAMSSLRELTTEEPKVFLPKLVEICNSCGVALVLVPEFKKLTWSGATKWIGDTAVIILNLRGKAEDKFWFSFFHESGHVVLHNRAGLLINDGSREDAREIEANEFAYSVLFGKHRETIPHLHSLDAVRSFAYKLGISPGIVAGQYQFMTKNYTFFHGLIRKFSWATEG